MTNDDVIRVMLVDDHDVVRRGLAAFIENFDDLLLVGEASTGQEAILMCADARPDVILMDMLMPGMDGITTIRAIHRSDPNIRIVALTSSQDESLMQMALKAGAIGYLLKNASMDELVDAIRRASIGKPTLATEAIETLIRTATQTLSPDYRLTQRELDVLALLIEGQTNRQIAQQLGISLSTVKYHVSSILSKLNVASRTEAVAVALQYKLVN